MKLYCEVVADTFQYSNHQQDCKCDATSSINKDLVIITINNCTEYMLGLFFDKYS